MKRLLPVITALLLTSALFMPTAAIVGTAMDSAMPADAAFRWSSTGHALLLALVALAAALMQFWHASPLVNGAVGIVGVVTGAVAIMLSLSPDIVASGAPAGSAVAIEGGLWLFLLGLVLLAWQTLQALSAAAPGRRLVSLAVPVLFGAWLLYLWQAVVVGLGIPQILLPAPGQIGHQLVAQAATLWLDFQQTFLKSVLAGFVIGCGLGFAAAVLTDRVPFLQRGLLPLGNMVSAVPIIGVAPIMVMWFGFGWESKAAVIVVMTFFPMLINSIAGLAAADAMQRDLMRSYGASYWQTFFKLRLPAALPFVFNALKINSTLALIGAIVAEFFGSPISGMGFRISTEVYKMNVDIVWATIAVAALAGSLFYGLLALIERGLTFWHPSYRSGR